MRHVFSFMSHTPASGAGHVIGRPAEGCQGREQDVLCAFGLVGFDCRYGVVEELGEPRMPAAVPNVAQPFVSVHESRKNLAVSTPFDGLKALDDDAAVFIEIRKRDNRGSICSCRNAGAHNPNLAWSYSSVYVDIG
jgi:hypothetical protein